MSSSLRTWVPISAAAALLVAAALFLRAPALELRAADGRLLAAYALDRRQPAFQISYLHSVARLPAVEYFREGPGGELELYKTAYQGLGAGLPFTDEGGTVRLEGGWILIEGLHRRFPSVTLSPMPLTRHSLRVGGRQVDLSALSGGRPIRLRIARRSLIDRLVRGAWMEYMMP